MSWSDSIALRGGGAPFEVLPRASELLGPRSHVDFGEIVLARTLEDYARRDPHPIPRTQDREGYQGERHHDYWLKGLAEYLALVGRLAEHGQRLAPGDRVVDLGCASGRVLRHFACQFAPDHGGALELWGLDVNLAHVRWVLEHLPGSIRAVQNHALPWLPLEDDSVALLYGFSVFTHIDEFELGWLAEIRRALRPGGAAYLTIHSERTWARLDERMPVYRALLQMTRVGDGRPVTPELLAGEFPAPRAAFEARGLDRVYDKNVFHSTDLVRGVWGRLLDVVEIWDGGSGYQDAVLLRKPRS